VSQFHSLTISDIRRETPDCVSIAFEVPPHLASLFEFSAGQNVTLRLPIRGEEVRRSYSICSSPAEKELRVAVKHVPEGMFSAYANRSLQPGDKIEVLPPSGRFSISADPSRAATYVAFAAGSGITPIISIIKTILASEPKSRFILVYGNRDRSSIIFKEQIEALKNRYMDRFAIHHILSREKTDAGIQFGRIDEEKCELLSKFLFNVDEVDHCFICGPEQMIFAVRDWLLKKGKKQSQIHFELFTVPGEKAAARENKLFSSSDQSLVKLKLDGIWISFEVPFDGATVLDAALKHGADLPYACKGGVCATCRARLLKGEVEMDTNYALEEDELQRGFILTCQSHPRSPELEIDFDQK
jgi:ring-1,2-phenylacetyl-CoA epoxidase subunit PaaE